MTETIEVSQLEIRVIINMSAIRFYNRMTNMKMSNISEYCTYFAKMCDFLNKNVKNDKLLGIRDMIEGFSS